MHNENVYRQIYANPRFQELVAKRGRFAWMLSAVMLGAYLAGRIADRIGRIRIMVIASVLYPAALGGLLAFLQRGGAVRPVVGAAACAARS